MPFTICLPYIDPKGDKIVSMEGQTSIFLPSEWLAALVATPETQAEFDVMFGTDSLSDFWSTQDLSHPKFAVVKHKHNMKSKCIPMCLHGDGAEFQDRDSLMSISLSGLFKDGSTLDSSLLLA